MAPGDAAEVECFARGMGEDASAFVAIHRP